MTDLETVVAAQQLELNRQAERIRVLYRALHLAVGADAARRFMADAESE